MGPDISFIHQLHAMLFFEGDRDSSYDDYLNDLQKGGDGECRLERWWLYNWQSVCIFASDCSRIFFAKIHFQKDHSLEFGLVCPVWSWLVSTRRLSGTDCMTTSTSTNAREPPSRARSRSSSWWPGDKTFIRFNTLICILGCSEIQLFWK